METSFYLSVTTTKNNWRELIEEADRLKIEEICYFPTALTGEERKTAMGILKKSKIKRIPLVHIRADMNGDELEWFWANYGTRVFNIHSSKEYPLKNNLNYFRKVIFIETGAVKLGSEPMNWAGVCPDFSHIEHFRLLGDERYSDFIESLEKYPRGVGHINAVSDYGDGRYDRHCYRKLSEFDYLLRYVKYLPEICALELENTLTEQLEAKKYLEEMVSPARFPLQADKLLRDQSVN